MWITFAYEIRPASLKGFNSYISVRINTCVVAAGYNKTTTAYRLFKTYICVSDTMQCPEKEFDSPLASIKPQNYKSIKVNCAIYL